MKFHGKIDWTDYLQAQYLHIQEYATVIAILYIIIVSVGFMFVGDLWLGFTGGLILIYLLFLLILAILYGWIRFFYLPRKTRRIYAQTKDLQLPMEFEIKDEGLQVTNEHSGGLRLWKDFFKWNEDSKLLMLYVSEVAFILLPKRFFTHPGQIEAIKRNLANSRVNVVAHRSGLNLVFFILLFCAVFLFYFIYRSMSAGG